MLYFPIIPERLTIISFLCAGVHKALFYLSEEYNPLYCFFVFQTFLFRSLVHIKKLDGWLQRFYMLH